MNDRRAFIRKFGRGVAALGLMGVSGYLLFRDGSREACSFDFVCGNCRSKRSCDLPEAKNYRDANPEDFKSR